LSVVCKHVSEMVERPEGSPPPFGACNRQLLGLAFEPLVALQIATDFFNWDLEAHGQNWRLSISESRS
jgi:hypothetical protein